MLTKKICFKILAVFIIVGGISLFVTSFVDASDHTFTFAVDRFEISGNAQGNPVDEFNDGDLSSWSIRGTATEAGDKMTLSNPGDHDNLLTSLIPIVIDVSSAKAPATFNVVDGGGNFTATSTWEGSASLPASNSGEYHLMGLSYNTSGSLQEIIGIFLTNVSGPTAILFSVSSDLLIGQFKVVIDTSGVQASLVSIDLEANTIKKSDVTGNILTSISFDDATNEITISYSIDSGATLFSPFTPLTNTIPNTSGQVIFHAGVVFLAL